MANLDTTFEPLPSLDTTCGLSPLSSSQECPSLSRSFSSDGNSDRRSSFASLTDSPGWSGMSTNVTTPVTPARPFCRVKMEDDGFYSVSRSQPMSDTTAYSFPQHQLGDPFWDGDAVDSALTDMSAMPLMSSSSGSSSSLYSPMYHGYSQSMSISNPSLSRAMFGLHDSGLGLGEDDSLGWSHQLPSPPQTIAPSAAYQHPMLTSSSPARHEPSTPIRCSHMSSSFLGSSPLTLMGTPVVPSQPDMEDTKFEESEWALLTSDLRRRRTGMDRLQKRPYERKKVVGQSHKAKPVTNKSGIDCEVVIPQNEFACSYPGCIDKQTGKPKRFKRQEHKKRHEKTVHEKDAKFKCWVPGCKTGAFTRTDNLKSHLQKTHGKKSPNQRNRYVATQDKDSEHFDPEWQGPLTEDGLPL